MGSTTARKKPNFLTLGLFNAHGLKKQREEITPLLRDKLIDILLVQETLLKPSSRSPRIANYALIRDDRTSTPGGGTAIYHRRCLHIDNQVEKPSLTHMEVSCCRIALTGHRPIIAVSAYLPPDKPLLESDLRALLSMGESVIIAGDLNSKHVSWNCVASNPNGRRLYDFLETDDLNLELIAPLEATHYPYNVNHRPDILDIALFKGISLSLTSIRVYHELESDHRPVVIQLGPVSPLVPEKRIVTDWTRVREKLAVLKSPDLDLVPDDISTPQDVDTAISCLTRHLGRVVTECSEERPVVNGRWELPAGVKELIRKKNAARRLYHRWPSEDNRVRMRQLQREVKESITQHRSEKWDSLVSGIKPTHRAYWSLARALKTDRSTDMPPLTWTGRPFPAFTDEEKAECMADSLEQQCTPNPIFPSHSDFARIVDSSVSALPQDPPSEPVSPVTPQEVQSIIRHIKKRKAPGADVINNQTLKCVPFQLIALIAAIFTTALKYRLFPHQWKHAVVIGIHKPGKKSTEPSSYRPISLLSSFGKLYERTILTRIQAEALEKNMIPDVQFGFRARHSCVHQLHRITEHMLSHFNRHPVGKWGTGILFFDVAKAFDKVWHQGLIFKLNELGLSNYLIHIVREFLSDRTFQYRVNGALSSPRPIRAGVPQGAILSPFLYSLFTYDMPKDPYVQLALFADDTALYVSDLNKNRARLRLQRATNAIGDWFLKWRIGVNPEKSQALYVKAGSINPAPKVPINLYEKPIPWVRRAKYLGVTLDNRLSFMPHSKIVRDRSKFILARLSSLLNSKSKMPIRSKITLYKACVRPVMTYASVVFAHKRTVLKDMQVIQSRFLRRALGAPWYCRNTALHTDVKLESIHHFVKRASKHYFDNLPNHPNPLVSNGESYAFHTETDLGYRRPRDVLNDPDDEITVSIEEELARSQLSNPQSCRFPSVRGRRRRPRPPASAPSSSRPPD